MCEFTDQHWMICMHHTSKTTPCSKQLWKKRGASISRHVSFSAVRRPSFTNPLSFLRKGSFSNKDANAGQDTVGAMHATANTTTNAAATASDATSNTTAAISQVTISSRDISSVGTQATQRTSIASQPASSAHRASIIGTDNTTTVATSSTTSSTPTQTFCEKTSSRTASSMEYDLCPSCVSTFDSAGIGHLRATEVVKAWKMAYDYHQAIRLSVSSDGEIDISGYTEAELAELGQVVTGLEKVSSGGSGKGKMGGGREDRERAPWRVDGEREAFGSEEIELSESLAAAKEQEKVYADLFRRYGDDEFTAAPSQAPEQAEMPAESSRDAERRVEMRMEEERREQARLDRRAEIFARADPRGGGLMTALSGVGDVSGGGIPLPRPMPRARLGRARTGLEEDDGGFRPRMAPVRAQTGGIGERGAGGRGVVVRGPSKPKVKTRGDAFGDGYGGRKDESGEEK